MNILDIFWLGMLFQDIFSHIIRDSLYPTVVPLFGQIGIVTKLKNILKILKKNNIFITTQKEIRILVKHLQKDYSSQKSKISVQLRNSDRIALNNQFNIWLERFNSEFKNQTQLMILTDSSLNIEKLLIGAKDFFQKNTWKKLSKIEKDDLQESVNCLLSKAWTASGIMNMRALESGIQRYYSHIKQIDPKKQSFGQMVNSLKMTKKADTRFLNYLDYLVEIRNNLAHPNKRIKQNEAEQVFQHTINVLETIYSWI